MRVLVLSNGELKERDIPNTLEELQKIVGGYIEFPFLGKRFKDNVIDIIINEEGKFIDGLQPEIAIIKRGANTILDVVYGNCIFASHDKEGNTIALDDEQIKVVKEQLKTDVLLTNENKSCLVKALFV